MAHWTLLAFLMPALLAAVFCPLHADPDMQSGYASASCFRKETYNTTSKVKVQVPVNKTRYDWCLGGFMRCVVYKVEMAEKEINVTEIRSRIVEMCCPGMIPAPGTPTQSTNESLQCIPAPGTAHPPMTSSPATIVTTTSREVCKTGLWGRGCSNTCLCGGAPCNQDTGACLPCSPNDTSCASSTSTTVSTTTSTRTTTPVPITPSSTPLTTTSRTPKPMTTSTPSTTMSTTMISTLATTKTSTQRSVETSPRVSLSNASEIPVAASSQSSRTVSITSPATRLTEFTTVRPIVATREQSTIERRKEAPGKSMVQTAKTTAQPIDPEAVNRVDIGNGKPKPDSIPTNTSTDTPPPLTSATLPSTRRTSSSLPPPSTIPKASTTTLRPTSTAQVPTTKPLPKQSTPQMEDTSSEEADSDEGDDDDEDDDDGDDGEEDDLENTRDYKLRQETILSPPGKPATRVDKIQTKINGSQHLMTWTFQTDFSVGPPIKLATPHPRKNAIPPGTENRNASVLLLDKNSDDKIGVTTITYGVKPWMPALNLATEAPTLNDQTTRQVVLGKERTSFDKPMEASSTTPKPTTPTIVSTTSNTMTSTFESTIASAKMENDIVNSSTLSVSMITQPVDKTINIPQNRTVAPKEASTSAPTISQLTSIVAGTFNSVQNSTVSTALPHSTQHIPTETRAKPTSGTSNTTVTSHSVITQSSLSAITSTHTPTSIITSASKTSIITSTSIPTSPKSSTNTPASPKTSTSIPISPTNSTDTPTSSITLTYTPTSPKTSTSTPTLIKTSAHTPTSSITTSYTPTSSITSTQLPSSQPSSSTFKTSTSLKTPPVIIPTGTPPDSVQNVLSSTVLTTSSTLGQTPLQGHIDTTTAINRGERPSVEYSVTTLQSVHDISHVGSPPGADLPNSPSAAESGGAGVTVVAIAIVLAILAIVCVLVTFARTRKQRNKRRPRDLPPPSPPLISAWHSEPHYSETFAVVASAQHVSAQQASAQPASARIPTFSDQFEQPAVEHVYQEITPLANVIETSAPPSDSSTRHQDIGPTKVMVKLRTVETYVVR